jgi:3-oxoacyl-[acyl-carrier-protein] synthase II
MTDVVITGLGLVTPLGREPGDVVARLLRREAVAQPVPFSASLACRAMATVPDFRASDYFPDNKSLRLMNRDAQFAVVAARLALQDAGLASRAGYPPDEMALYGATGLSGIAPEEIARLVRDAAAPDGSLDLQRFGQVTLRRIRPVLSFKILANMPICFVSIFENLRGPNAVYTPWEGDGAQAIRAGVRAIRTGEVPCALVGGCDVKTHALSLVTLQQLGIFDSWARHGCGCVPGEGAAFLVLEDADRACSRGARCYATVRAAAVRPVAAAGGAAGLLAEVAGHTASGGPPSLVVAAADGDPEGAESERAALDAVGLGSAETICPKQQLGNLFAASAPVQLAVAAEWARRVGPSRQVLANCFGYGDQQAAFALEAA